MMPLVTVSIPLYKCEEFLIRCLDSVLAQDYPHVEVILVNDQTPDRSVEIVEKFINDHQLAAWRIIHLEKNSGLSVVRNQGIKAAAGKYLFFLDSDDRITPDCISTLVEIAEKEKAEMTVSQLECEQQETGEKSICIKIRSNEKVIDGNLEILTAFAKGELVTYAVNKLFLVNFLRRSEVYFVPGLFAQDELWTFHLVLKLSRIAIHKKVTYTYFLHQKSVIHNRGKVHFDNWATIVSYFRAAIKPDHSKKVNDLIKTHLINYKTMTLIMNWKAKKSESDWLYSHHLYQRTPNLSFMDYLRSDFSLSTKKKALKLALPSAVAMKLFKYQYQR